MFQPVIAVPVVGQLTSSFLCSRKHNKAAVQIKEDMKKMVQLPMVKPRPTATVGKRVFGVPLLELRELGLVEDGVPQVVRRMVEYLLEHGKILLVALNMLQYHFCFVCHIGLHSACFTEV